jgi:hypothetical protein
LAQEKWELSQLQTQLHLQLAQQTAVHGHGQPWQKWSLFQLLLFHLEKEELRLVLEL